MEEQKQRDMDEDGAQSSSQYIEMDLAMHSNGWDSSSPRMRKLQKPLETREFEFYQQSSLHLVPADELFFRGKLLPLHPDPRLRFLQALRYLNRRPLNDEAEEEEVDDDDDDDDDEEEEDGDDDDDVFVMETEKLFSPMPACDDDRPEESAYRCAENGNDSFFSLHCAYRVSSVHVLASSSSKTEESLKKNDSGSSSFRSQQSSNFWSYGERDSRDSMSSSRYSDGSSQDVYPSLFLNRDMSLPPSLSSLLCTVKPNAMAHDKGILLKAKKWTQKVLLGGLKTASKVFGHTQKRSTSIARTSVNGNGDRGSKPAVDDHGFPGHNDGKKQKDRDRHSTVSQYERQWSNGRNPRETWQRYAGNVKRPLLLPGRPRISTKNRQSTEINRKEDRSRLDAKKMSSKQMMRLPNRKVEQQERRMGYGMMTSCPASMSSSPNHSGILAVMNKSDLEPLQDGLQNAIQSAINHCKQSQQQATPSHGS